MRSDSSCATPIKAVAPTKTINKAMNLIEPAIVSLHTRCIVAWCVPMFWTIPEREIIVRNRRCEDFTNSSKRWSAGKISTHKRLCRADNILIELIMPSAKRFPDGIPWVVRDYDQVFCFGIELVVRRIREELERAGAFCVCFESSSSARECRLEHSTTGYCAFRLGRQPLEPLCASVQRVRGQFVILPSSQKRNLGAMGQVRTR